VIPGRVPAFEEIEPEVHTAWLSEQKTQAWENAYKALRAEYTVLLPKPPESTGDVAPLRAANGAAPSGALPQ